MQQFSTSLGNVLWHKGSIFTTFDKLHHYHNHWTKKVKFYQRGCCFKDISLFQEPLKLNFEIWYAYIWVHLLTYPEVPFGFLNIMGTNHQSKFSILYMSVWMVSLNGILLIHISIWMLLTQFQIDWPEDANNKPQPGLSSKFILSLNPFVPCTKLKFTLRMP